jgi:hypothetical protein
MLIGHGLVNASMPLCIADPSRNLADDCKFSVFLMPAIIALAGATGGASPTRFTQQAGGDQLSGGG